MKQRLFIAISFADNFYKYINSFRKKYNHLDVRWLTPSNLHITLVPPFYEEPDKVISLLKSANFNIKPFDITFEKVEFGPNKRKPRLIWGIGKTPTELQVLSKELHARLKIENTRPFKLHTTLARFSTKQFNQFAEKELSEVVYWNERVASLVLLASHLSKIGAEYELLYRHKVPGSSA
jgi:RNA 2',3'-cyclic 3'-phosphodiesterase